MNKDVFCVIPWIHFAVNPQGYLRSCCLASSSGSSWRGLLKKEEGIFNASKDNFKEIKNAYFLRELRMNFLEGEKHDSCRKCWNKESLGETSRRMSANRIFADILDYERAKKITKKDGSIDIDPVYFDLRFGNKCNLKCVMCHPSSSDQWYEDYVHLRGDNFFSSGGIRFDLKNQNGKLICDDQNLHWYENDNFWKQLFINLPNLKQLSFSGGEPLLSKKHYDFLREIVDTEYVKNITLEYDTNLTILPDKILDVWRNFKKIIVRASVDDTGERNEYIRFGCRWDVVVKNIDILKNEPNIELSIFSTLQIFNVLTMGELNNFFKDIKINTRILYEPEYLDVKILPQNIKKYAIKHFEKCDNKLASNYLKKYYNHEDRVLYNDFLKFVKKMDDVRGTSFDKTFKILSGFINQ